MLKENSRTVWQYLKDNYGTPKSLAEIATATGLSEKQVNGCVLGLQRKSDKHPVYAERTEPTEIELADGTHKSVKLCYLTEAGFNLDPDQE